MSLANAEPGGRGRDSTPNTDTTTVRLTRALVAGVCEKILTGDFASAGRMLDTMTVPEGSSTIQLKAIVDEYRRIDEQRQTKRNQAREKALADLQPFNQHIPTNDKDRDNAFEAVLRLYDSAPEDQRKTILDNPTVCRLIADAIASATILESQGRWADAYSHAYGWLTILDKENRRYKEKADELTARAALELALKNGPCDAVADRYKGVRYEMLIRAITTLDFKYVELVDYDGMVRKTIEEAERLAIVLDMSPEPLSVSFRKEGLVPWRQGVAEIRRLLDQRPRPYPKEEFLSVMDVFIALNPKTLKISEDIMIGLLAEAALSALDPYTTMVWPKDVAQFQKVITQEFDGIGVRLNKQGKFLKIAGIIPDSPASRTDMEEGEMIVAVNGESTEDMSSNCAVQKISGPRGTRVTLSVRREGSSETRQVVLTRAKIIIPSVTASRNQDKSAPADPTMIDPANRLGYIRLTSFVETTIPHLEKTLTQLEAKDLRGLILDLRGNAGGLLQTAIEVVDLFVNEGPILQSRSRFIMPSFWNAKREGTHPDYPLVILIDGGSASASEIVAGALQDSMHRRATLVGSRSFGKGSVQEISHYTGFGSQFKYTTAHYHLPGGQPVKSRYLAERRNTEDWGVRPDVEVKLRRSDRMNRDPDSNEVESRLVFGEDAEAEIRQDLLPASLRDDTQLAVGLLVLQTKLIQSGQAVQVAIAGESSSVMQTEGQSAKSN